MCSLAVHSHRIFPVPRDLDQAVVLEHHLGSHLGLHMVRMRQDQSLDAVRAPAQFRASSNRPESRRVASRGAGAADQTFPPSRVSFAGCDRSATRHCPRNPAQPVRAIPAAADSPPPPPPRLRPAKCAPARRRNCSSHPSASRHCHSCRSPAPPACPGPKARYTRSTPLPGS